MKIKSNSTVNYLLFLLLFSFGCSTTKTTSSKTNDEKGYKLALKKLKKGKSIDKNKALLVTSINKMITTKTIIRDSLSLSDQIENKEQAYEINNGLLNVLKESSEFTDGKFTTEMGDIQGENIKLKNTLKTNYYTIGKNIFGEAKKNHDKYLSQDAYRAFLKSKKYGNNEIEDILKESLTFSHITYYISAEILDNQTYNVYVDDQFKELEKLELRFANIIYGKEKDVAHDCRIEVLFDRLMINEGEESYTDNFEREVKEPAQTSDGTSISKSVIIRGSVTQQIKKRTLGWGINVNTSSTSSNCKVKSKAYTERFVSESIRTRIGGDRRAIPAKYKDLSEVALLNRREMMEEAIKRVYLYTENELRRNH